MPSPPNSWPPPAWRPWMALVLGIAVLALVAWIRLLPLHVLSIPPGVRGGPVPDLREELTEHTDDGERYVFLGDNDSYAWLRAARNLERSGTPCDSQAGGVCRDERIGARDGVRMVYADTLHVYAIALFHRVARLFRPHYPWGAAGFGVSLVVSLAGALLAFAVGWRLGGPAGAVAAGFFPALQGAFLNRSLDGDNDCWQLAIPLAAAWALVRATSSEDARRGTAWAAAAGFASALHAWAWRGWVFFHAVWLVALVAWAVAALVLRRDRSGLARLGAYALAAAGGALLFGAENALFPATWNPFAGPPDADLSLPFPDVFATVGELGATSAADVAEAAGGWVALAIAAAGALGRGVIGLRRRDLAAVGAALVVGTWLGAAAYQGAHGLRFLMLVGPPVALGWALAAGLVAEAASGLAGPWRGVATGALALAVVGAQVPTIRAGYDLTVSRTPTMTGAWWRTFEDLSRSAPGAVVHTWWDQGYWAKFVADRRVHGDGGTLRTHTHHWFGRALLRPEDEAVGILRMLDCGNDLLPLPEGQQGALALAARAAGDDLGGLRLLDELMRADDAGAARLLAARGLRGDVAGALLEATHCTPPEAYVVLSSSHAHGPAWLVLGGLDVGKATLVNAARRGGEAEVRATLARAGADAAEIERTAPAVAAEVLRGTERPMLRPVGGFPHEDPLPCTVDAAAGLVRCTSKGGPVVDLPASGEPTVSIGGRTGTPELVVLATEGGVEEHRVEHPGVPGLAVLFDQVRRQAFVLPPALARSSFVRLFHLDARGLRHFEKVSERTSWLGERVATFRVRW